jgi:hypothetical protein
VLFPFFVFFVFFVMCTCAWPKNWRLTQHVLIANLDINANLASGEVVGRDANHDKDAAVCPRLDVQGLLATTIPNQHFTLDVHEA